MRGMPHPSWRDDGPTQSGADDWTKSSMTVSGRSARLPEALWALIAEPLPLSVILQLQIDLILSCSLRKKPQKRALKTPDTSPPMMWALPPTLSI